jgi:hypothetical protein
MTTESDKPQQDRIDELIGRRLDSESMESDEDVCESFSPQQVRRASELQLVHALLTQLADRDQAAKERRIQNLMQKIDSQDSLTIKLYRIVKPLLRYGIAAAVLIVFVILFTQIPTNTAMASMDKMIAAMDIAGDRTYSIKVEGNKKDHRPPLPPDQPPQPRQEAGERAGLDGATLYLQGSSKFVLYWNTPSGKTVINGSDGQTNWHIRPDKPVLVSNNPQAFRIPMPPELAAILTMDFKATLVHIRDNYKIKFLEDVTDSQKQNSSRTYLDAQKISNDFPGPKNIEIWADTQTGLLLRIEFADIHMQGDPSPKRLIIELKDQTPQPQNWFTRQAHHAQDAQVDFVSK